MSKQRAVARTGTTATVAGHSPNHSDASNSTERDATVSLSDDFNDNQSILSDNFSTASNGKLSKAAEYKRTLQRLNKLKEENMILKESLDKTNMTDITTLRAKLWGTNADLVRVKQRNLEMKDRVQILEGRLFKALSGKTSGNDSTSGEEDLSARKGEEKEEGDDENDLDTFDTNIDAWDGSSTGTISRKNVNGAFLQKQFAIKNQLVKSMQSRCKHLSRLVQSYENRMDLMQQETDALKQQHAAELSQALTAAKVAAANAAGAAAQAVATATGGINSSNRSSVHVGGGRSRSGSLDSVGTTGSAGSIGSIGFMTRYLSTPSAADRAAMAITSAHRAQQQRIAAAEAAGGGGGGGGADDDGGEGLTTIESLMAALNEMEELVVGAANGDYDGLDMAAVTSSSFTNSRAISPLLSGDDNNNNNNNNTTGGESGVNNGSTVHFDSTPTKSPKHMNDSNYDDNTRNSGSSNSNIVRRNSANNSLAGLDAVDVLASSPATTLPPALPVVVVQSKSTQLGTPPLPTSTTTGSTGSAGRSKKDIQGNTTIRPGINSAYKHHDKGTIGNSKLSSSSANPYSREQVDQLLLDARQMDQRLIASLSAEVKRLVQILPRHLVESAELETPSHGEDVPAPSTTTKIQVVEESESEGTFINTSITRNQGNGSAGMEYVGDLAYRNPPVARTPLPILEAEGTAARDLHEAADDTMTSSRATSEAASKALNSGSSSGEESSGEESESVHSSSEREEGGSADTFVTFDSYETLRRQLQQHLQDRQNQKEKTTSLFTSGQLLCSFFAGLLVMMLCVGITSFWSS